MYMQLHYLMQKADKIKKTYPKFLPQRKNKFKKANLYYLSLNN